MQNPLAQASSSGGDLSTGKISVGPDGEKLSFERTGAASRSVGAAPSPIEYDGGGMAESMKEEDLARALRQPAPTFAAEALRYAKDDARMGCRVSHRILSEALAAACQGRLEDLGFGPIYAAYLLGYHRDADAFDRLAEIARLSREQNDEMLGDTVTEDGCAILWSVCGGSSERLLALVDDPATDTYWSSAALRAITIGVAEGVLGREQMLQALRRRLEVEVGERRPDQVVGDTPTWLVRTIAHLGVGGDPALLDTAYDKGMVHGPFLSPDAWHGGGAGHARGGRGAHQAPRRVAVPRRSAQAATVGGFLSAWLVTDGWPQP